MDKNINDLFYSPDTGYISATKLYKKMKVKDPEITLAYVKDFLNKQHTVQVNKPRTRPKEFSSIVSPSPRNNYQMDILVYDRYEFNHYKYILVIIDVYSRYVSARAMTTRKSETIMTNIKDIFKEMGIPKNMNCDNEFNTKIFNSYMNTHNVTVFFSQPDEINKNAIVERWNRTIAETLQKWRIATGKHDWAKVLPKFISNYNNTWHSTIKATPYDVFNLKAINTQKLKTVGISLNVGDQVRIKLKKSIFAKGDEISYSTTIYTIIENDKQKFKLRNNNTNEELKTLYKQYELIKVNQIQYLEKEPEEEKQHAVIQQARKLKRAVNKEGVEVNHEVLRRSARERKPASQLENAVYGNILYS
jgi:hypothetical protein